MEDINKELFQKIDKLIIDDKGYLNEADFFRLVSQYQLSRIDKIENANNNQQRAALCRTAMYDTTTLEAYKKTTSTKKKLQLVPRLVNLLCIANNSINAVELASPYEKEIFYILLKHKEKIILNKEWYLRVIPEARWLITYFEETECKIIDCEPFIGELPSFLKN